MLQRVLQASSSSGWLSLARGSEPAEAFIPQGSTRTEHISEMATIRSSGFPPRNRPNSIRRPWAFPVTTPENAANFCVDRRFGGISEIVRGRTSHTQTSEQSSGRRTRRSAIAQDYLRHLDFTSTTLVGGNQRRVG